VLATSNLKGVPGMITAKQIKEAKKNVRLRDFHHEHYDCVLIAYEWLDAQKKTKKPRNVPHELKYLIERWAGRYVSQSDVEIAAYLHPSITGNYPFYNISSRLTEPSTNRLKNIGEALTQQGQREEHQAKDYSFHE
jgi:hypothetical protein